MRKAVPYYRVSTDRQGRSGLGLEAQKTLVTEFAQKHQLTLLPSFVEIESGNNKKRPLLLDALQECKKYKATLLIAKLDRLGRNVAFVSKLMESNVDFIAVDNPTANKLVVHIMAAFAEYERDQISTRTKQALAVAKSRGIKLGLHGSTILAQKNKKQANDFAVSMKNKIEKLKEHGYVTIRAITRVLNEQKVPSYKGGNAKWHTKTVHQLLKRMKEISHNK